MMELFSSRIDQAQERISVLRTVGLMQSEIKKTELKRMKKVYLKYGMLPNE